MSEKAGTQVREGGDPQLCRDCCANCAFFQYKTKLLEFGMGTQHDGYECWKDPPQVRWWEFWKTIDLPPVFPDGYCEGHVRTLYPIALVPTFDQVAAEAMGYNPYQ